MFGFGSKEKRATKAEDAPSPLAERVAALEADFRHLRRSLDDLDDNLRSFKGRHFKRAARAEADDLPPDATTDAPPAPDDEVSRRRRRMASPTFPR